MEICCWIFSFLQFFSSAKCGDLLQRAGVVACRGCYCECSKVQFHFCQWSCHFVIFRQFNWIYFNWGQLEEPFLILSLYYDGFDGLKQMEYGRKRYFLKYRKMSEENFINHCRISVSAHEWNYTNYKCEHNSRPRYEFHINSLFFLSILFHQVKIKHQSTNPEHCISVDKRKLICFGELSQKE